LQTSGLVLQACTLEILKDDVGAIPTISALELVKDVP